MRARPNTRVVLSGMVGEFEEAMQVVQGLPVTVIAGKTTLQELMNLIMGSVGVISVDTGVAHMAAQLGKPLVVMATCLGLHWWKEEQYGAGAKIQLCTYSEPSGHISKEYPDCINKIDMHEVAKGALTIGT